MSFTTSGGEEEVQLGRRTEALELLAEGGFHGGQGEMERQSGAIGCAPWRRR
jgi:hypothetical protein